MARSNLTKVAINGFGRIGRLVLRTLLERCKAELAVLAINDMADLKTNAHLFRYDSTYGIYPGTVECADGVINVDGNSIAVLNQKDPARLPWNQLGVEIVIEATGVFTDGAQVRAHLDAGAKKAIVTAPATHEDITLVLGVNDGDYNPRKHHIVSNASCTT
ncbi:MAG: glyceraldehyde 3-phosphate dehydrogenase N-terminal domain-containing protein, partial [Candidatus Binatota bacterium]|nr:glyceraldehyde 3-phosphate dehydrogenase N-terminal domain-containing protein [Candidatus Binatota bacterium]